MYNLQRMFKTPPTYITTIQLHYIATAVVFLSASPISGPAKFQSIRAPAAPGPVPQ